MLRAVMIDGRPGTTVKYTASDVATALPAAILTNSGASAVGLLITCETYPIRIAFVADASLTVGHILNVGDVYRVYGNTLVSELTYINATLGSNGVLQVTPFYT